MVGCENMTAMAAESTAAPAQGAAPLIVASGDVCASGEANSSHACCKKNKAAAKKTVKSSSRDHAEHRGSLPEVGGTSSGTMNSCPLAMGRTAVVAKPHYSDTSVNPALTRSFLPQLSFNEITVPLNVPLRLPNRGHTYLNCCSFLI